MMSDVKFLVRLINELRTNFNFWFNFWQTQLRVLAGALLSSFSAHCSGPGSPDLL